MTQVRTRFAPSPTGYMHVGNLRTALYAYLLAKKDGGTFILRIEDTDQERYVEGAVDIIYNTLKETGLIHDEGPDVGGDYGPYIQTERMGLYKEYAIQLIEKGEAYYCFCDKERLDGMRRACELQKTAFRYDGSCRNLSKEEVAKKLAEGVPYVIRQKIPTEGTTTFDDAVYGSITVDNSTLDDQILIKSDGLPTYNFANVVDDHLMGITHIVRGSEYLSSTPKYNLLYKAFGWDIPVYVHVSPVMRDAQRKLSKRDGDASYQDFIDKGFLSEAVMNYIALLGWNPGDEREKFTMDELIQAFNIRGISKSPAIFDAVKLQWLNGEYIRELTFEAFFEKAEPFIKKGLIRDDLDPKKIAALLHTRTEKFSDIPEQLDFFNELPEYSPELYIHKKMKTNFENSLESLKVILPAIEELEQWDNDSLYARLLKLAEETEINKKKILWSMRVAVSGKQFTPGGGTEIAAIVGKEDTLNRVRKGIELLEKTVAEQ